MSVLGTNANPFGNSYGNTFYHLTEKFISLRHVSDCLRYDIRKKMIWNYYRKQVATDDHRSRKTLSKQFASFCDALQLYMESNLKFMWSLAPTQLSIDFVVISSDEGKRGRDGGRELKAWALLEAKNWPKDEKNKGMSFSINCGNGTEKIAVQFHIWIWKTEDSRKEGL